MCTVNQADVESCSCHVAQVKNRESAARSRARKQEYTASLEQQVPVLKLPCTHPGRDPLSGFHQHEALCTVRSRRKQQRLNWNAHLFHYACRWRSSRRPTASCWSA